MKVYIALPISGHAYEDIREVFSHLSDTFKFFGYEVLSPMTAKGVLRNELEFRSHGYDNPVCTNHAIFERDKWMVSNCDIIFVYLKGGGDISIGCMMELAWASLLGKHSIVVMGGDGSIYNHAFVLEAADIIFHETREALDYMKQLIEGKLGG